MNSEITKHKRYDEAFKRSAVEHWMLSGQTATQIARELGINGKGSVLGIGYSLLGRNIQKGVGSWYWLLFAGAEHSRATEGAGGAGGRCQLL